MEKEDFNINKNSNSGMLIVGINLIVLAAYTFVFRLISGGIILDAFVLFLHVVTCFIIALAAKRWIWFLAGILVLVIGFSTCVNMKLE